MIRPRLPKTPAAALFAFCLALALSFPSSPAHFWETKPDADLVEEITANLDDTELLGQVFFLGYVGRSPSDDIKRWITSRNLGGVKIFTRNVTTLPRLAADVRELQLLSQKTRARIPLLVATDQEGGWVKHIRKEASSTGGNLSLAAGGVLHDAYLTGYYLGEELKAMGVNMNFAPTLDIYTNPEAAPGLAPRYFSSDPLQTALLGAAYIQGQRRAGVIGTGKHFPGHGDAHLDSHGFLPVIDIDEQTLWNRELLPYRIAVREGLPAVMSAHLAFPRVTGRREPASQDAYFLKTILRERLGFQGVVVTDDMEMNGAIAASAGVPEACYKALMAGNDMILVSHTPAVQELAWDYLARRMRTDQAFRNRVREAVRRILSLKLDEFKGEGAFPYLPDPDQVSSLIPAPDASDFFFESACRGVTLVKGARVPFRPSAGERLILISQYSEFIEEGKKRFPEAEALQYSWDPMYRARPEETARASAVFESTMKISLMLAIA